MADTKQSLSEIMDKMKSRIDSGDLTVKENSATINAYNRIFEEYMMIDSLPLDVELISKELENKKYAIKYLQFFCESSQIFIVKYGDGQTKHKVIKALNYKKEDENKDYRDASRFIMDNFKDRMDGSMPYFFEQPRPSHLSFIDEIIHRTIMKGRNGRQGSIGK